MRGEISSGRYSKRHPLDWYVDPTWCAEQLALALDGYWYERAHKLAIWDPCCGMGNTLDAAQSRGVAMIGSDLVDNLQRDNFLDDEDHQPPQFINRDFLEFGRAPAPCSIICNPPYSYKKGIAERFARHAIALATKHACILMPNKWLAPGKDVKVWSNRLRLFREDHPPLAVLHLSERPSMPPGDKIRAMGSRAFRGGMIDYTWIVWDVTRDVAPGQTRTIWLPPLHRNDEIRPIWEMIDA